MDGWMDDGWMDLWMNYELCFLKIKDEKREVGGSKKEG